MKIIIIPKYYINTFNHSLTSKLDLNLGAVQTSSVQTLPPIRSCIFINARAEGFKLFEEGEGKSTLLTR